MYTNSFRVILTMTLALLISSSGALGAEDAPSPEEALRWLKQLDENYKEPRFAALTLENLKTLEEIKLGGHRKSDNKHVFIAPADFRYLAALPALKRAILWEIDGLDDSALVHVGRLTTLTRLELGDAAISSAGIKHLADLKDLTFLGLGWTKDVGDDALPHIAQLQSLEQLVLSGTRVTDAGIVHLARLPKLAEVRLVLPQLTDRGLLNLKDIKTLKVVVIGNKSKVTPTGIAQLKKHLPEVVVK